MTPDQVRLNEIRQRIEDAPVDVRATYFGDECFLEAKDPASMDEEPPYERIATMPAHDQPVIELLRNAFSDLAFMDGLIRRASAEIRRLRQEPPPPPEKTTDYAKQCAILCGQPTFRRYLQENWSLDKPTKIATEEKVREMLRVGSRKALNEDPKKAAAWVNIVTDFEKWKRT